MSKKEKAMKISEIAELYNHGYLIPEIKLKIGAIGNDIAEKRVVDIIKALDNSGRLLQGEELNRVRQERRKKIQEVARRELDEQYKAKAEKVMSKKRELERKAKELSDIQIEALTMLEAGIDWNSVTEALHLTSFQKSRIKPLLSESLEKKQTQKGEKSSEELEGERTADIQIKKEMEQIREQLIGYLNCIEHGFMEAIDFDKLKKMTRLSSYNNNLLTMCLSIYEGCGRYQEAAVIGRTMITNEKENDCPDQKIINHYQKRVDANVRKNYFQQVDAMQEEGVEVENICSRMDGKLYPYAIKQYLEQKRKEQKRAEFDKYINKMAQKSSRKKAVSKSENGESRD